MKSFFGEGDRRFRILIENIVDVVTVLSIDGRFVYTSPSIFNTLGYAPIELVGKNAFDMLHPLDLPRATKLFAQILIHPGETFATQLRFRHKKGNYLWLDGSALNQLNDPDIHGVVVNFRDVTNRMMADEKTRQRAEQMSILYKTTQDLVMERNSHRLLHVIVERAVNLLNASAGGLYLCEPEKKQVRCEVSYRTRKDYTGMVLKYGEGAAGYVAQTGKPLIIDDYSGWKGRSTLFDENAFTAILSVPMKYQKDLIGVLHILEEQETHKFSESDLKIVSLFANQAAIAVANTRLIEQVQNHSANLERRTVELARSNSLLASLHSIAAGLMVSYGSDEILNIISTELTRLKIGHGITLFDPDTNELVSQYVAVNSAQLEKLEKLIGRQVKDLRVGHQVKGIRTPASIPFLADFLETGSARYLNDLVTAIRDTSLPTRIPKTLLPQAMKLVFGVETMPAIILPLKVREQKLGLMAVWDQNLKPEDVDIFVVFAAQIAIALDNSRLMELERKRGAELEGRVVERTRQLESLLQEKEVLLREVYHRVKNNLQVINSLLSLQAPRLETKSDEQIFVDIRERVRAMALVHEKLYQSDDLARVDFEEYIQNLIKNLARAYMQGVVNIDVTIHMDKVWLGLDTAVPCGLIVNELVANAFKHAFPPESMDHQPEIHVSMRVEPDERFTLTIADNGVGMPKHLDWRNAQTMGLQLVTMLIEQLDGDMHVSHEKGTTFTISFYEVKYKERK